MTPVSLQYMTGTQLAELAQQARAPELLTAVNAEMNRRRGGNSLAAVAAPELQSAGPVPSGPALMQEGPVPVPQEARMKDDAATPGSWTPPWQRMGGPSLPSGTTKTPAAAMAEEDMADVIGDADGSYEIPADRIAGKRGPRAHDDNLDGVDPSLLAAGKAMADAEDNPSMIEQLIAQISGGGMSDDQIRSNAIAKAGFAMAASKSPYFLGGVGEGGLAGMEAYEAGKQEQLMNRVRAAGLQQNEDQRRDAQIDPQRLREGFDAYLAKLPPEEAAMAKAIGPENYADIIKLGMAPVDVPAAVQEFRFAVANDGYKGTFQQWVLEKKRAGANGGTSVNINMPKSIGKGDEKMMELGAEGYMQAQEVLPLFGIAREAAKNFSQSGPLGGVALFVERGKNYLGLPNNAQAGEVLQGMQTRLGVLQRMPGSGATSNMEMNLYMSAVPGLLNSQQGNMALADIGEKLTQRRMQNYQKMQGYISEHGSSVGYIPNDEPLLSENETEFLKRAATGAAPAGAPSGAAVDTLPEGFE